MADVTTTRRRPDAVRVLLADDHEMILDTFGMYLTEVAGMQVATATSLDEAVSRIEAEGPFDIVLLDLNMPGMNGVVGLKRALRLCGRTPVAILTGGSTPRILDEVMGAGAAGIVLKTTGARTLTNAIRFMQSGEKYLPMELLRGGGAAAPRPAANGVLSEKEMRVLPHLAEGRMNKEIAKELQLAEPTVKMHVTAICRKLGAHNRTQAAIIARDIGLI